MRRYAYLTPEHKRKAIEMLPAWKASENGPKTVPNEGANEKGLRAETSQPPDFLGAEGGICPMRLGDHAIALPASSPPDALHTVGLFLATRSAAAPVQIPLEHQMKQKRERRLENGLPEVSSGAEGGI